MQQILQFAGPVKGDVSQYGGHVGKLIGLERGWLLTLHASYGMAFSKICQSGTKIAYRNSRIIKSIQ